MAVIPAIKPTHGSLLDRLDARPMRPLQITAVTIAVVLNAIDGFDVLAVTFALPGIAAEWRMTPTLLGLAISSGLIGMAAGSLLLAPRADRVGRRPLVLACLAIMTIGMALCGTADGLVALCCWRALTGIGIGGMVATINAVAAEFANARWRALCVAVMTVGYPAGGLVGGLAAASLVEDHGWRTIFRFGAAATAALLPIAWVGLPESPSFLVGANGARQRLALVRLLARLGLPADLAPAEELACAPSKAGMRQLLDRKWRTLAALLTGAYCLHLLVFYVFSGWLPKMTSDLGYSAAAAIRTSSVMSIGGVVGGTLFGWATPRLGLGRLVTFAMIGTAAALALVAALHDLVALRAASFLVGMCLFGGIVGLYSLLATSFPAELRATGTGLAIGVGRGGAVVGPVLGGVLMQAGLGLGTVMALVGLCSPVAALLLRLARQARSTSSAIP